MKLLDWVDMILSCRDNPDVLNLNAIEEALSALEETIEEHRCLTTDPEPNLEEEVRTRMVDMVSALDCFCDYLDQFLDDLDFDHLLPARTHAHSLWRLYSELRSFSSIDIKTY